MKDLLTAVFDNYFSTRARLGGKATLIGTDDQKALLNEIPARIEAHLARRNIADLYKVKGSIGNGNIARVPWVGIFRREITENAENGYYIVLLFSENMSSCFLSLNQGITAIEQRYTKSFAWKKMEEAANRAWSYLNPSPELWRGKIPLASTGDLGRAYEAAAIASYEYRRIDPPSDARFFEDLDSLIAHYETLFSHFKNDLHSLFTVNEEEFQRVMLEKAAQLNNAAHTKSLAPSIPTYNQLLKKYIRSPVVAATAVQSANFLCEIDANHWTFVSKAKKQRYVEAHHLIPISQQQKFSSSLDIVENIVALCATCHRLLHFGAENERKSLLIELFNRRKQKLFAKNLKIKPSEFIKFYANEALLEE